MICLRVSLLGLCLSVGACGTSVRKGESPPVETDDLAGGGDDGGVGEDLSAGGGDDAGMQPGCAPTMGDLVKCGCDPNAMPRACWPASADPKARHVGACKDGMQPCVGAGEFWQWGMCSGAVLPMKENCTDKIDNDCNGLIDCKDPACATDPACRMGCMNGATRVCYDGPPGTQGVGLCKPGIQTCVNGVWPMNCPGEVLPANENCGDCLDHNCNHLPGCFDVLACILDAACQGTCKQVDQGCFCPQGVGEVATCPGGMHGITKQGNLCGGGATSECCPCTANDCGDPRCCHLPVCKGNKWCDPFDCTRPLPMDCNGRIGFDCDDFPEDCDVHCCVCIQGC